MPELETIDITITGLRAHYRRGDFSPRELVALLRERSARYRDRNIWIYELSDAEIEPYLVALDRRSVDDAPLYGIPFAIKDNIDLAGLPTTAGCPEFAYSPENNAVVGHFREGVAWGSYRTRSDSPGVHGPALNAR